MLGFDLGAAASLKRFQTEFENLGEIGAGGFSIVSKVRNRRDHKTYALKTVRIKPSQWKAQISQYIERVLSQARILSTLRHPNIIGYHGCWLSADQNICQNLEVENEQFNEEDEIQLIIEQSSANSNGFQFQRRSSSIEKKKKIGRDNKRSDYKQDPSDNIFGANLLKYKEIRIYLLLQLGDYSLQKYVNLRNKLTKKTEIQKRKNLIDNYKIVLDVIEGLMYIHNESVIHRDIKLQNIIIDENRKCKIIDFGLAKKVRSLKFSTFSQFQSVLQTDDRSQQKHSSSVGTKIFSSPEQRSSEDYDYRTDIYSVAMVIGVLFSDHKTQHEQRQILKNLRNRKLQNFNIDQKLKGLLFNCLGQQKFRPGLKQIKNCVKCLFNAQILGNIQNLNILKGETLNKKYDQKFPSKKQTKEIISQKNIVSKYKENNQRQNNKQVK